jgi:hypothetical protein
MRFDDPSVDVWENSTLNILDQTFGQPSGERHHNTRDVAYARSGVSMHVNMSDGEIQQDHIGKTRLRKALLLGFIEQLQDLAPPGAATEPQHYSFHSEIQRTSEQLFRDLPVRGWSYFSALVEYPSNRLT